jgi:hypothetical protein
MRKTTTFLEQILREPLKRLKNSQFLLLYGSTMYHWARYTNISANLHIRTNGENADALLHNKWKESAEHTNDLDDRFYGLIRESLEGLAFILAEIKRKAPPLNIAKRGYFRCRSSRHATRHTPRKNAYPLHLYCSFVQTNYFLKCHMCCNLVLCSFQQTLQYFHFTFFSYPLCPLLAKKWKISWFSLLFFSSLNITAKLWELHHIWVH